MARTARIVVPHHPHHVTQRGNRRLTVFFDDDDYELYLEILDVHCQENEVVVWAYCLMPNNVHIVAVTETADGLARAIGETNRRYAWAVNRRQSWTGHLWQGRFGSCVMDEAHTLLAMRYVERNPVRAKLVDKPEDWPWSSARAHLGLAEDPLIEPNDVKSLVTDWRSFLDDSPAQWQLDLLRLHERTGRPLGSNDFLLQLERQLGKRVRPNKRGRKPKTPA